MKVIITGVTGMVGEGVMLVCLDHPEVTEVLTISRRTSGHTHSKLKEMLIDDFSKIHQYRNQLSVYDACFFCAGVSSVGETEESFTKKTYDFVVPFAEFLAEIQPKMVFTYVSGTGTDSTEKGKTMWARVKGRTENAVAKLGFRGVYNFRPGMMKPMKGQRNLNFIYKVAGATYPIWSIIFPKWTCTLQEVGLAMIHCVIRGYPSTILEVVDMKKQALR